MDALLDIQPYHYGDNWLIGPRSYLMDRYVPQPELIHWPGATYDGGLLTLHLDDVPTERRRDFPRKETLKRWFRAAEPVRDLGSALVIDLRHEPFFNWSHHLNNHLPLCLVLRDRMAAGETVTILGHAGMKPGLQDIYRQFGFETLATDAPVRARFLAGRLDDSNIILSHQRIALEPHLDRATPAALGVTRELPRKIFITRRGTRAIENEAEIEAVLLPRGYEKIYAEDLSMREQIASFSAATDIVAIHGAALAPIIYRASGAGLRLVEILPPGHMTHYYRMMCHQIGADYVGVRGRIKAAYVPAIYNDAPFLAHSIDTFEVDPLSLRIALHIANGGAILEDYPANWAVA